MSIEDQGAKPTGKQGVFMGKMMNAFHTGAYKKYFKNKFPDKELNILDIGCGGGALIKYFAKQNNKYMLFGLDHSDDMVTLAKKVNQEYIVKGQVSIESGSVTEMNFKTEIMDIVMASETVQFWPSIPESFSEVYRVLKKGGCFYIINRYPKENTKWWNMAKLKNEKDFIDAFEKAGFKNINIDLKTKKGWIITKVEK